VKRKKVPYTNLIIVLSVAIPLVVLILFNVKIEGYNLSFLPPIYATINGITAILLLFALAFIKKGNVSVHQLLVKICMALSLVFLLLYVAYHATSDATHFGGEGWLRYVYYFILITHILLSVCVIPVVLFTFSRAISGDFERHKKLAKFAFPLWLYVAISGVVVYLLISPYY